MLVVFTCIRHFGMNGKMVADKALNEQFQDWLAEHNGAIVKDVKLTSAGDTQRIIETMAVLYTDAVRPNNHV